MKIIKSFALPKILYGLTLISSNKEFIKKVNTMLFSSVSKGKDKDVPLKHVKCCELLAMP